ncbi:MULTISPECIES: hypothetical protein [Streptomyces]|uniref:hypothetical protein n=1 Tax=Streptomyces TaxID=1883 RepID=UPI000B1A5002|nr:MULTISPECIES: hypothetical protein [Streptomyces]
MHRMTSTLDAPRAGIADDMTEDDNRRGYERDETDSVFRQLVGQLVLDGHPAAGPREPRRVVASSTQEPLLFLTGKSDEYTTGWAA